MNKLYHRIASKLQSYQCEFVKAEEPDLLFESVPKEDIWANCMIIWKCKCGEECSDFAYSVDRSTTPLCSFCERLEVGKVLDKDKRVYLYGVTRNFCKLYCDVCKCMFKTGKLKAYKKILIDKVVCVQCNKQRSYSV